MEYSTSLLYTLDNPAPIRLPADLGTRSVSMTRMKMQYALERHAEKTSTADDRVKGTSHDSIKRVGVRFQGASGHVR